MVAVEVAVIGTVEAEALAVEDMVAVEEVDTVVVEVVRAEDMTVVAAEGMAAEAVRAEDMTVVQGMVVVAVEAEGMVVAVEALAAEDTVVPPIPLAALVAEVATEVPRGMEVAEAVGDMGAALLLVAGQAVVVEGEGSRPMIRTTHNLSFAFTSIY